MKKWHKGPIDIHIDDEFRISSYSNGIILYRRKLKSKELKWSVCGYYNMITDAIMAYFRRSVEQSGVTEIKQLLELYNEIEDNVTKLGKSLEKHVNKLFN